MLRAATVQNFTANPSLQLCALTAPYTACLLQKSTGGGGGRIVRGGEDVYHSPLKRSPLGPWHLRHTKNQSTLLLFLLTQNLAKIGIAILRNFTI